MYRDLHQKTQSLHKQLLEAKQVGVSVLVCDEVFPKYILKSLETLKCNFLMALKNLFKNFKTFRPESLRSR